MLSNSYFKTMFVSKVFKRQLCSNNESKLWIMVSGFSRFSSRKDLDLAIGEEITPESIDIIIAKCLKIKS